MIASNRPKICIYVADITPLKKADLFDEVYRSVSEEREKKIDRMRFQKDRCLSLGVECLLMCACRDFGVDYERERVITEAFSKPKFADLPLHFNLSHSEERVMCVMSNLPVGCDVEKNNPIDLDIAKRFFFEEEYRAIESCETQKSREDLFFRLWTLKESFMKCTGLGFQLPLNEFSISVGPEGIRVKQSLDDAHYIFFEKDLQDGYKYAWCIRAPAKGKCVYDSIAQFKQIEFGHNHITILTKR